MDLKAVIRELLFSHDCVIIPGFGGFIGNYSPARIERTSGQFSPPVKKILFNVKLNHNDGLLISRISQLSRINYGDSRRLVDDFAGDLNRKLARGERVVFDHIGTVSLNAENKPQFEPETDINYLVDSYGLESFQCLPVDYDVRKRVLRHIDRDSIRQIQLRKNIWRAAVIIPIIAILVAVPLKTGLFKTKVETSSLNPLVTAEFENNKKAVDEAGSIKSIKPNEIIKSDSVASDSVKTKTFPSENITGKSAATMATVPEKVSTNPVTEVKYVIVTGSFRSEENALSHVRALKTEGFSPEIVKAANGYFRVYAMKCPDMKSALFRKDSISKKFPDTWITKN